MCLQPGLDNWSKLVLDSYSITTTTTHFFPGELGLANSLSIFFIYSGTEPISDKGDSYSSRSPKPLLLLLAYFSEVSPSWEGHQKVCQEWTFEVTGAEYNTGKMPFICSINSLSATTRVSAATCYSGNCQYNVCSASFKPKYHNTCN